MSAHLTKRCSLVALAVSLAACTTEQLDRPPPAGAFYFPTGIVHLDSADPAAPGFLYVANSNFDRRFDRGSVTAVDLSKLALPPVTATAPAPERLNAVDLQLAENSVVYVENFAGHIAASTGADGAARLVLPTRSEGGLVHLLEANGPTLRCAGTDSRDCRPEELDVRRDDSIYPRGPEPFGVAVVGPNEAYVTQLEAIEPAETETELERQNFLVKLDPSVNQSALQLDPPESGIPNANFIPIGIGAADSIAVGQRFLYLSGRLIQRPTAFLVRMVNRETGQVSNANVEGPFFAQEARGIALSEDESRLYLATRAPDALIVLRLTGTDTDAPGLELIRSVFLPDGAGPLRVIPREGRASLVAVASQEAGVVSLYDDELGQLVTSISGLGDQPFAIAADVAPGGVANAARLYVTAFRDGRVAVIDIPDLSAAHSAKLIGHIGRSQECLTDEQRDEPCPGEAE